MPVDALVQNFLPSLATQVALANWRKRACNNWAFRHIRGLMPTADIPGDPRDVWKLAVSPTRLNELKFDVNGATLSLKSQLEKTDSTAIIVLSRSQIVFDHYAPSMDLAARHILMSVSKSLLGLFRSTLAA